MIIGNFRYDPRTNGYVGEIHTLAFRRENVVLLPREKSTSRQPDYDVVYVGLHDSVQFGAAWLTDEGQRLSVRLDDPSFVAPITATMLAVNDSQPTFLEWSRPTKRKTKTE